jgi:hypothetical protein
MMAATKPICDGCYVGVEYRKLRHDVAGQAQKLVCALDLGHLAGDTSVVEAVAEALTEYSRRGY